MHIKKGILSLIILITIGFTVFISKDQVYSQSAQSFPVELYKSYGFPAPDDPLQLTEEQLYRWNTFYRPHAVKAAQLVNVDIGLVGMWPMIENHITSHMDNCYDGNTSYNSTADFDPNTYCAGWGGNWQVGYGMHPAYEYVWVKEAYENMRSGDSIQAIGQRVIDTSTDPKRYSSSLPYIFKPYNTSTKFPNITLDEMINGAVNGDADMRWALGTFMKDDGISAYLIAKKFKSYVDANSTLTVASRIEGWAGSYNRQRIVNVIAGIYEAGVQGGGGADPNYRTRSNPIQIDIGKPTSGTKTPAPPAPDNLQQAIMDEFGINFVGFSNNHLQWAWTKFWDIKHTKFFDLVPQVTVSVWDDTSAQLGCDDIRFRRGLVQSMDETLFKLIIIHELGHVIYWCNSDATNFKTEHANAFWEEGGVTYYGEVACYGTPPVTEDYAETITYYLNPGIIENTGCDSRGVVPYADGKYPLHYAVAQKILGKY